MHDSSDDLLGGGGKSAESTFPYVGTLTPTTLTSMARLVVVAFDTVQTTPFTRSRDLAPFGTYRRSGARTPIGGRGRADLSLMVMLRLSLLRGIYRRCNGHGCDTIFLAKGISREGCEHD